MENINPEARCGYGRAFSVPSATRGRPGPVRPSTDRVANYHYRSMDAGATMASVKMPGVREVGCVTQMLQQLAQLLINKPVYAPAGILMLFGSIALEIDDRAALHEHFQRVGLAVDRVPRHCLGPTWGTRYNEVECLILHGAYAGLALVVLGGIGLLIGLRIWGWMHRGSGDKPNPFEDPFE